MRRDSIVIVPYDPSWPRSFEQERDRIEPVLRPWLVRPIEHVGSTSIPGMPAKAIIDMLAVVRDIDELVEAGPLSEVVGWVPAPEPGDSEARKRSFCAPNVANRTHHLHVVEDSSDWRVLLAFRNYLRLHPGLAGAYAALKRELAAAHGADPNQRAAYRAGKATFIQEVTQVALGKPAIALLRDATVDDAAAIAEVHVASWRAAYRGLLPDSYLASLVAEDRLAAWRDWLQVGPPAHQAIVVVADGQVRGFSTVWRSEVGGLYLDPSYWRRGLGRALLEAAVDRLRRSGHAEVGLWVHPENARARRFYEAAGWEDDGVEQVVEIWGVEFPERRYRLRLR